MTKFFALNANNIVTTSGIFPAAELREVITQSCAKFVSTELNYSSRFFAYSLRNSAVKF